MEVWITKLKKKSLKSCGTAYQIIDIIMGDYFKLN